MVFWKKRKKNLKQLSGYMKVMLKPILFALLPVLKMTIDLWKIQLLDEVPNVSTEKLKGWLSDKVDDLSSSIIKQIKKGLEK